LAGTVMLRAVTRRRLDGSPGPIYIMTVTISLRHHSSSRFRQSCLQRQGILGLPDVEGDKPGRQKFGRCHDQLRTHLAVTMDVHDFARSLTTWSGLTPQDYIVKTWTWASEPGRSFLDPTHQISGRSP
jgi:hypothetical protein